MSIVSYSVSNFSRVKNTLSGRKAMLLEDKSLLRNKNYQTKILLKQIETMNIPAGNIIQTS